MGTMTHGSHKARRKSWARGLRVGALVALLALLVVVPVALAATSSTTYDFAPSGVQGLAGEWKNASQAVSIVASPSADSTVTAHFSSDNGLSWTTKSAADTHTATFSFAVIDEGSNAIKYYASDTSPDTESPQKSPGFINIDKTKPTFTTATGLETTSSQSSAAGWSQVTTRTVTLTATDTPPSAGIATSGMKEVARRINGGLEVSTDGGTVTFLAAKGVAGVVEGSNAVNYSAKDWAGNVESKTGYINIDTVEPSTTPSPALASSATTGWRNSPLVVTLNWTDVSSGVPTGGTSYRVNDGNPVVYVTPFTVSAQGSTKLTYRSIDRALNAEATQTAYVNIDETTPTVSAATAPAGSSGWYNTDVVVTLTGVDAVSGIAKTQYRLQADPPLLWVDAVNNQFTVLASVNAVQTFQYQAVDKAGNVSLPATLELKMDSVKPQASGKAASGKHGKDITLKYKFTDNMSPSATGVYVKITNSKGTVVKSQKLNGTKAVNTWYSFKWKAGSKGTYYYYVHGLDLAGNTSTTTKAKITVK
jgi:hypothetical protein